MSIRSTIAAILLSLCAGTALAEPARLVIYVLDQGRPAAGVAVTVDGEPRGETDGNGAARLSFEPGVRAIRLSRDGEVLLERFFDAGDGELAQWIVALRPGQPPRVSVESSKAGRERGVATGGEAAETPRGPPGLIRGRVISAEDDQPVSDATIYVSGSPVQVQTDAQGHFRLELGPGEYAVSTTHPDFATRTLDGVAVESERTTPLQIEVTPAGLELADFVVVEPYVEGSLTSVLAERRQSDAVTDVLSAEQISRAGDSDAAGALKRVTGLTLVDGEYVYVRGLGERYSSVLLNGATIPSPDPTRRVVPLDLFPTDVIRSVVIQKTAGAGMPGDFGGGTVQLRTVRFPENFIARLSVSGDYNELATFESGLRTEAGGRDWTGFDDGTRDMPASLAEATADGVFLRGRSPSNPDGLTPEEFEELGEDLAASTNYDIFEEDLDPGFGAAGTLGNSFALGDGNRWGFLAAFQYDSTYTNLTETRRTFAAVGDNLQIRDEVKLQRTQRDIDLGGFVNFGLEIGDDHKLGLNTMFLRQTEDEARRSEGEVQTQVLRRFTIEWIENELFSNQLTGEHTVPLLDWGLDMNLDWQYTDATASRYEPNTIEYRRDDDDGDGVFIYSTRADSNSQIFADLGDDLTDWSIAAEVPVEIADGVDLNLEYGRGETERHRDSSIRTFNFQSVGISFPPDVLTRTQEELFVPEFIGSPGLRINETTQSRDNYMAAQELEARYFNLDLNLYDQWRLTTGLRTESNQQTVTTFSLANPDEIVTGGIDQTDRLPSAALTWSYSDAAQFRLGYAETLNRPDLRELSPSPYQDPILDLQALGNPDLETASIKNYDARWEYYFSSTDSFSMAGFYKEFSNPIEKTFVPQGSSQAITLQNALSADVYGVEFDLYRTLSFAEDLPWIGDLSFWPVGDINWGNYYVATNYTWLESSVQIDTSQTSQTNPDRPLQGASPWVANFQVGYTNPGSGHEWTLLYNESGERIAQAGVQTQPDVYEQPLPQLDFVYRYSFADNWRFSLKLQNLLDPDVEFLQGGQVKRTYNKGRELSIGLQWTY